MAKVATDIYKNDDSYKKDNIMIVAVKRCLCEGIRLFVEISIGLMAWLKWDINCLNFISTRTFSDNLCYQL